MAGSVSDDYGSERSFEGFLSGQNSHPVEALAEWRSREQVDNGTPSTSPAYWFSDNDDDSAPKPSELYGRHTWKIEKFSQNTKRELKSEVFDVGGYKWYILIYPQGCDVSNHLSLFLCVANYDKLLPGWSHFAQFTIVVVNSDPRKSKYSDTLHRFWKKEHDWGWKKYMELSKVQDGFIVADTLEIRAQVQVIREKAERPFRCLHRQYRRELARAYLTNAEQICRRLVEDKRAKLRKLINDRVRWLSFYTFWLGVDQSTKDLMSREKIDAIMRVVVKHLFVEKEVSSALIMDSLDSGMKALEAKSKSRQEKTNLVRSSETSAAFIWVEDDMFVLADDVLVLLERAAVEPLPSKDDKGPQNHAKEGNSGEDFIKDSIEWNERRLTELGLKTIETLVLAHIYSEKIEVAYQEAIALKRQEELIREEEAAGQAEIEQKAKRKTAEKEKRFKKKTNKQQRSNRKGKYRGKDEKSDIELAQCITEKPIACEVVSDVSDRDDNVSEIVQLDVEATHSTNWDADTSGALCSTELCSRSSLRSLTWHDRKSPSSVDDSSSTCSTDSVTSVVMNGSCERKSTTNYRTKKLPNREKNRVAVEAREQINRSHENNCRLFDPALNAENWNDASKSSSSAEPEPKAVLSSKDHIEKLEQHFHKKGGFVTSQKELIVKGQANGDKLSKQTTATEASSPRNPTHNFASGVQTKWVPNGRVAPISVGKENSSSLPVVTSTKQLPQTVAMSTPNAKKAITTKPVSMPVENPTSYQVLVGSTPPSSVSIVTDPRPTAFLVSTVQTAPVVSRVQIAPSHSEFLSTGGQLGSDTLPAVQSFKPLLYSQPGALPLSLQNSAETDIGLGTFGFTFGSVTSEILHNQHQRADASQGSASTAAFGSSLLNSSQNLDSHGPGNSVLQTDFTDQFNASVSTHRTQRAPLEEFPHLDIINYLFDEELGSAEANGSAFSQGLDGGFHHPSGHQLIFANDTSTLVKMGSTVNGQFGHPMVYYDDKGQPFYGSFCSHMNGLADVALQVDFSLYGNGHFDGMIQNQWPLANGSNPYLLNDAHPFLTPEYSNLACVGGYTVFQSSSGH